MAAARRRCSSGSALLCSQMLQQGSNGGRRWRRLRRRLPRAAEAAKVAAAKAAVEAAEEAEAEAEAEVEAAAAAARAARRRQLPPRPLDALTASRGGREEPRRVGHTGANRGSAHTGGGGLERPSERVIADRNRDAACAAYGVGRACGRVGAHISRGAQYRLPPSSRLVQMSDGVHGRRIRCLVAAEVAYHEYSRASRGPRAMSPSRDLGRKAHVYG